MPIVTINLAPVKAAWMKHKKAVVVVLGASALATGTYFAIKYLAPDAVDEAVEIVSES